MAKNLSRTLRPFPCDLSLGPLCVFSTTGTQRSLLPRLASASIREAVTTSLPKQRHRAMLSGGRTEHGFKRPAFLIGSDKPAPSYSVAYRATLRLHIAASTMCATTQLPLEQDQKCPAAVDTALFPRLWRAQWANTAQVIQVDDPLPTGSPSFDVRLRLCQMPLGSTRGSSSILRSW